MFTGNSSETFQEKIIDLFQGLDFIHDYIKYILDILKGGCKYDFRKTRT